MKKPAFTFKQYINEVVQGNWGYSQLLGEALTEREKNEVNSWPRGDYSFSDHAFGGDSDQMRTVIPVGKPSGTHPEVAAHLEQHGYKVSDYAKGLATDKYNREVKIGKALEKTKAPNRIFDIFENDQDRSESGQRSLQTPSEDLQVVISRHPHDVGGMSTDRGWSSCMDMRTGCNRHYLAHDIQKGTHVAYLTRKGDDEAEQPLARIALKPFHGENDGTKIIHPESKVYANKDPYDSRFTNAVNDWANQNFPKGNEQIYKKDENVYDDDGIHQVAGGVEAYLKHPDDEVRARAYRRLGHLITPEHIEKTLSTSEPGSSDIWAALRHPKASAEIIDKHWDHLDDYDKGYALENPNAPKRIFDEAMKMGDTAQRKIAQSPAAPAEHLTKLIRHFNPSISETAANNPNTPKEARLAAVSDPNVPIETRSALVDFDENMSPERIFKARHLEAALDAAKDEPYADLSTFLKHQNATPKMIDTVLDSPDRKGVRNVMWNNPEKLSKNNWQKALNHPDPDVHEVALMTVPHPDMQIAAIEKHFNDPTAARQRESLRNNRNIAPEVFGHYDSASDKAKEFIISHDFAPDSVLEKALKDPNPRIRGSVVHRPYASMEHLEAGMNDPDSSVRLIAGLHNRATREMRDRLKTDPDPRIRDLFKGT